jgi:4-amino-4-deoxy-L-arabinose transferase-like glycosyltransferase
MSITTNRLSWFIIVAVAIVVFVIQSQNILQFPYYQDVEGTNLSNVWAIIRGEGLSPYAYTYDEPPLGSYLISGWAMATGGLDRFGTSLYSGRILMLIMHLFTLALVYSITRKVSGSDLAAIIATLILAFSPLAIGFQRRILLDNIMIVWLLASLYLMLGKDRTLVHYVLSAIFFSMAVLTKGAAIAFMPAMALIIMLHAHKNHRRFALWQWVAVALLLISFYPLYAQMRHELFPEGTFLGGDFPHVSLLERMAERGALELGTGLEQSFNNWVNLENVTADPILVYGGFIATVFMVLISMDNKNYRPLVIMTVSYGLYLFMVREIYNSDIITLLPFLAINSGLVIGGAVGLLYRHSPGIILKVGLSLALLAGVLYPFGIFYVNRLAVHTEDQVQGQFAALDWLREYAPQEAVIVTDNYAFVELRETFPNTHHYWRVDTDPAIKYNTLNDDLCNIDFVLTTPQVLADINSYALDLMRRTIEQSELLMTYNNNGWPVEIRQVRKQNCTPTKVSLQPAAALTN